MQRPAPDKARAAVFCAYWAVYQGGVWSRPGGPTRRSAPTHKNGNAPRRGGYHPPAVSSSGNAARRGQAPALQGCGVLWGATTPARPSVGADIIRPRATTWGRPYSKAGKMRRGAPMCAPALRGNAARQGCRALRGTIIRDHIHSRTGGRQHGAAPTRDTDRWLSCRGGALSPPAVSLPGNDARRGQAPALQGCGVLWGATTPARPSVGADIIRPTGRHTGRPLRQCRKDA